MHYVFYSPPPFSFAQMQHSLHRFLPVISMTSSQRDVYCLSPPVMNLELLRPWQREWVPLRFFLHDRRLLLGGIRDYEQTGEGHVLK